jgi:ABC-type nitrate/sulfonate/bicarbonate transport system ATPase subunit
MDRSYTLKDTLVTIKDVCMSFEGRPVLRNVNATVRDIVRPNCVTGQVIGILGPSGVGKTQLSRILTGLQSPTSGMVTVGLKGEPVKAGVVGYVTQSYPLLRHRTVLRNLEIAAERAGASSTDAKARSEDYLRRFDLMEKWDVYPSQLSGGQRQRVAIAQQLLCSEHFLVLDEPTTGLDPIMKDRVCDFIKQVSIIAEENTIFVISHDIPAVLAIADTLWLLGRERDAMGNSIGANIRHTYDLIEHGLAWDEHPTRLPVYQDLVREIRDKFETL